MVTSASAKHVQRRVARVMTIRRQGNVETIVNTLGRIVTILGIFMLNLIQKNNSKFVMTSMCTCVILLLLRLVANMLMNKILIIVK